MAISVRIYVFEEGGAIKRVPRRVADALIFGEDALPDYANTRQRIATVIVENEEGKPARIRDATGSYWSFNAQGRINENLAWSAMETWQLHHTAERAGRAKVVDLRPEIKKREWGSKNRWSLTAEDLDRIAADLWPGLSALSQVKAVKGKAPKKPPLTYEARQKLDEAATKLRDIEFGLQFLSEAALKGFAFEALKHAESADHWKSAWQGVAAAADHHREVKARHRTGRGAWYAILRLYHRHHDETHELDFRYVLCPTRKAAAEATKRLLAEHAQRISDTVTVETELLSELEWEPSEWDRSDESNSLVDVKSPAGRE